MLKRIISRPNTECRTVTTFPSFRPYHYDTVEMLLGLNVASKFMTASYSSIRTEQRQNFDL